MDTQSSEPTTPILEQETPQELPAESRMQRNLKKKSLRNILLALTGTVIVITLLILFGMQFLIYLSTNVGKASKEKAMTTTSEEISYIAPPIINPMFEATNSATVIISGTSEKDQTIKLYNNDKLIDTTKTNDKKEFKFANVTLEKGENTIKTKAVNDKKESEFSSIISITYTTMAPLLEMQYPQDGQTVKKDQSPITITGKTDQGVKVTINDFWAIVDDKGNFSYKLTLTDGDNHLKVIATDDAGNKTTKEITIKTE